LSEVDTDFAEAERSALVGEVREYLPGFLGSAATERLGPLDSVRELLNLRRRDLERVVAVHLALDERVQAFVAALRDGVTHPITSSTRPREVTQAVRGPIDWGATVRERASALNDPTRFVVRPAHRIFEVPENQALAWVLARLDAVLRQALSAESDPYGGIHDRGWFAQVVSMRAGIREVRRRVAWLRGIEPVRPAPATLKRLSHARQAFYKLHLRDVYRTLVRYSERPGPQELTELLCSRHFEPERNWQLFELVVALRLARAFDAVGEIRPTRLLVGAAGGRAPYATFELPDGDVIALWYQAWPRGAGKSLHALARQRHLIKAGASRPDLVIERSGERPDTAVLELKATRSGSYLADGLSQLLGYLKEWPDRWVGQPAGWLVAPASSAFTPSEPDAGMELWAVDADAVAEAAKTRFAA
jgi:hypothetical protein